METWTEREVDYLLSVMEILPKKKRWPFLKRGLIVAKMRLTGYTFKEIGKKFGVGPCRARQYLMIGHSRCRQFCKSLRKLEPKNLQFQPRLESR